MIWGKLYHCQKRVQLTCIISVITENKPHAHHKTHLHTTKVITILIPSFQEPYLGKTNEKKKPAFLQSRFAKACLTNNVTFDSKPTKARTYFLI